jgi:hypothetical protein
MDHPKPWLRYVDGSELNNGNTDVASLRVVNDADEDLGSVKGLVVDRNSGRPLYLVVAAPGWFTAARYLLPIGEIHRTNTTGTIRVDLSKDQVKRFPGFDTDEFEELGDADLRRVTRAIGAVFEPGIEFSETEPYDAVWNRKSYRVPDWWETGGLAQAPERRMPS